MKFLKQKKGDVWVSAILYILVISLAIVLIIKVGVPIIDKMKDKSALSNAKETMITLDNTITEVANEGEGSQRVIPVEIKDGKVTIQDGEISWELKTKTEILDERSDLQYGNMKISSNANVKTIETNQSFIMQTTIEGDIFNVTIRKIGTENSYGNISTDNLIESVYYDGQKLPGNFTFKVNGDSLSNTGTGYTKLIPGGNNSGLGKATVLAHINSTSNSPHFEYDLEFTLESFADFLTVELKNVK